MLASAARSALRLPSSCSSSCSAKVAASSVARCAATSSIPSASRSYASASNPTQMATPVDVETTTRAGRGSKQRPSARFPVSDLSQAPKHQDANRPIYLDAQSTTPVDPRVLDAMLPFLTNQYGNPHSRTHAYGWESEAAVEVAREHVGALIGADSKEIIFTSGATETNNMAIKGVAHFYKSKKNHIITTQTEHKCVLDSCRKLQDEGFEVTYLPVQENGLIDLQQLKDSLRPTTSLVSIMAVNNEIGVIQPLKDSNFIVYSHDGNNEIGVIQPLKEIGQMLKDYAASQPKGTGKAFFHSDGAQAAGKIEVDVNEMGLDLMSLSSHKLYGPKGIGAAYVRRRPRVRLEPIINGGGQERGLRSGTLAPPLVVGFGEAARLAKQELKYDHAHISALAERLRTKLQSSLTHTLLNGDPSGYPGCTNLSFQYVEGESLLMALKDVCLSSGSACTSASLEPSYVLRALGLDDENAHSSLRFGIGRFTTQEEVDYVAEKIVKVVNKLRDMSPLWEMVQEGIDLKTIEWSG